MTTVQIEKHESARRKFLALAKVARQEYVANGGEFLDEEGIIQELSDRRGGSYRIKFDEQITFRYPLKVESILSGHK